MVEVIPSLCRSATHCRGRGIPSPRERHPAHQHRLDPPAGRPARLALATPAPFPVGRSHRPHRRGVLLGTCARLLEHPPRGTLPPRSRPAVAPSPSTSRSPSPIPRRSARLRGGWVTSSSACSARGPATIFGDRTIDYQTFDYAGTAAGALRHPDEATGRPFTTARGSRCCATATGTGPSPRDG